MHYTLTIALLLLTAFQSMGQDVLEKQLSPFSELSISGRFLVHLTQGDDYSITVTNNDEYIKTDRIKFILSGERLTIKYDGSALLRAYDVVFKISVPNLNLIEAKMGAEINIDKSFSFTASPLLLKVQAGGLLELPHLDIPWVRAKVAQGGSISLTGKASLAEFEIQMGGFIYAEHLITSKINAKVHLGGEINCHAEEILQAELFSGGYIGYHGNPTISQDIKIGGTLQQLSLKK